MALRLLYERHILEHYKNPRNFGPLDPARQGIRAENPSCGDFIDLQLQVSNADRIIEVRFYGRGCAISQASASMMTECIKGMALQEAMNLNHSFRAFLAGEIEQFTAGDLAVFAALREFPLRMKCALLGWDALQQHLVAFLDPKR